jgi:hypothetical protein
MNILFYANIFILYKVVLSDRLDVSTVPKINEMCIFGDHSSNIFYSIFSKMFGMSVRFDTTQLDLHKKTQEELDDLILFVFQYSWPYKSTNRFKEACTNLNHFSKFYNY